MKYLTNLDLNLNELQNVVAQKVGTDPSSPVAGQFWYNSNTGLFKFYDGTNIQVYTTASALETALADYQAKIVASGILKGNGAGDVSAATAGTDYGYPQLTGAGAPTTTTAGAVGQHYFDTTNNVEYICKTADTTTPSYTWIPITTDISSKQDTITATGILKGEGSGSISAATAGTDYDYPVLNGAGAPSASTVGAVNQKYYDTTNNVEYICTAADTTTPSYTWKPTVTATASKALVTDANGVVVASEVTATELGYLSGVTSNVQTQLDSIPKYDYQNGVTCSVSDSATQSDINTAAIAAITAAYEAASDTPAKYDAVPVAITFTPSDKVKDALYEYNGSSWVFLYYMTTGIQRANGTTAGIVEEAASNSDISFTDGVGTVNTATVLRTARTISLEGDYNDGSAHTDGITNPSTLATFDGSADVILKVEGIKTQMLTGQVAVANGGTGKSSITEGNVLVGNSSGGFDELGIDSTVTDSSDNLVTSGAVAAAIGGGSVAHKYTTTNGALTPSSGTATWTVTHNLNSSSVTVQIIEVATGNQIMTDVVRTNVNTVTIKINTSSESIAADTYQVTVIG